MPPANAAPCRHRGAPREQIVEQVLGLLTGALAVDKDYLEKHGLTPEEYVQTLPTAVEKLRGRMAASNRKRRDFVEEVVSLLVDAAVVERYQKPKYGSDTVYRLFMKGGMQVGLIQKGCPDGKHSSVTWSRPAWADELYLWWVCDSKNAEPGEHIWMGVTRLRGKVSAPGEDQLDGLIFYNQLCGTPDRPCPKLEHAVDHNGLKLPPPVRWSGVVSAGSAFSEAAVPPRLFPGSGESGLKRLKCKRNIGGQLRRPKDVALLSPGAECD
jgi:hypothetical protein